MSEYTASLTVLDHFSKRRDRLTFTSTSIAGKKMIVQATNTGGDLSEGQFDLAIPGGGVGICGYTLFLSTH